MFCSVVHVISEIRGLEVQLEILISCSQIDWFGFQIDCYLMNAMSYGPSLWLVYGLVISVWLVLMFSATEWVKGKAMEEVLTIKNT